MELCWPRFSGVQLYCVPELQCSMDITMCLMGAHTTHCKVNIGCLV